jgi:hypothetical protein
MLPREEITLETSLRAVRIVFRMRRKYNAKSRDVLLCLFTVSFFHTIGLFLVPLWLTGAAVAQAV